MAFSPVKDVLGRVLRNCNIRVSDFESYKIFELWPEIVGGSVAERTRPVRIVDRRLFVEVDDNLWLTQMKYLSGDIVAKIDTVLKKGTIKDVRFFLKGFH